LQLDWLVSRVLFGLRYSARKFLRTPGTTLALLLSIALGVGSNVSVYGFVRGLSRSDSPLTSVDRIVSIFRQDPGQEAGPLSYGEYLSVQNYSNVLEWIGAARISPASIVVPGQSAIASVAALTPNLAGMLHLSLEKGVIISHRMWQTEFGGEADVGGKEIRMDGVDTPVSGVAPTWLEGLYRDHAIDVWARLQPKMLRAADRNSRNFWVFGRLSSHVSVNQAPAAVHKDPRVSPEITVLPYTGMTPEMTQGMEHVVALLTVGAGAVFFIACANVFCFLLGRAFARAHETSLRVALGARRRQLAGELLWDSVVIAIAGGLCGMLLAVWTSHLLPALLFEEDTERLIFAPHLFTLVTASAVCAGMTILCGLLPAFVISDDRPATVLRRENSGPSKATQLLRVGLIVAQMTACCVLVISTAFLLDSLRATLQTTTSHSLGEPILVTVQGLPETGIKYFQQVEQATGSMKGISLMAWTGQLPGSQPAWRSFRIDPQHSPLRNVKLNIAYFTSDSLKLFALPPKAGRLFAFVDQGCRVAIVNGEAAAELFDNNTVGRTIQDAAGLPVEIIGIVAQKPGNHVKENEPIIYYDYANQSDPAPNRTTLARFQAPISSELLSVDFDTNVVSPEYFKAMGLRLITGRLFTAHQTPGECRIGVVNQEAANIYFAGEPLGAAIIDDRGTRTTIVGVVQSRPLGAFQRSAEPAIYFPMSQDWRRSMTLIAGAENVKATALAELRGKIESVPGHGPAPVLIKTLDSHLAHTALAPLRIAGAIIAVSATTALLLSTLGLIGALSDAMRHRRRELSIRIALGAQRWRVIYQVLREGGRLACAGTIAGVLGSLVVSRWLAHITASNHSPARWVWFAAPLALGIAVVIASVLPARRALMINPLKIMREEN
jgi:ABC-type antimicrobial peptide transport system permease subunit